jgi:hypothetical protein
MRRFLMAMAMVGWAGALAAQAPAMPDSAARRAAMDRFDFLVGSWSGDAWAMTGPGQRMEMRQTETVRRELNGQLLLIEGLGRRLVDGQPRDTVFHAFATMDFQPGQGYRMRSYILNGHSGEFAITPQEGGFDWEAPAPGGRVVYRMRLTPEGRWDERGEYRRGEQGFPAMAMLLTRLQR